MEDLLEKALNFIVETQKDNDYICEKMLKHDKYWCELNCNGLNKKCVTKYLIEVYCNKYKNY